MSIPNATSSTYQVDFEPIGKRTEVAAGISLLEAAQQSGLALSSACGGVGNCGQCRVTVLEGRVSPPTLDEEYILTEVDLLGGKRLACRTQVHGNVKVHVPKSSLITKQRLQVGGDAGELTLDPLIRAYRIDVPPPTLHDPRSDLERIVAALAEVQGEPNLVAEPAVIRQLTLLSRQHNWHLTVYMRGAEIVGLAPPESMPVGLAVDLGTTKIAASLVYLTNGIELAVSGALNPQIGYGEDVVSRLTHAHRNPDGAHTLALKVREAIDDLLGQLTTQVGVDRIQVADICLVGNTAMIHLLTGLPVHQLAVSPFVAATNAAIDIKARDLGLTTAPGAYVHMLPCIGGFVGADHVAMILANHLDQIDHVTLGIDIGTNTEIVLARPNGSFLTSVSCASGPAFEGAHVSDGMRAASGAIEAVSLTDTGLILKTVDNAPAVGLCGSGIIDVMAELRRRNLINERGRFDQQNGRVRGGRHGPEFLLVPGSHSGSRRDVVITQNDINEIQLAKGAIRAGFEVLLDATGTVPEEVQEVIIAGAFGSFLKVQSAIDMGLLPRLPNARYRQVGNAAVVGARWALLSRQVRQHTQQIVSQTSYLELTTYPKYNRRFALGMLFPHIDEKEA
ncbi:MAG: ASKHA domain-containing protein [Syntrophales bacterium]|nr:ASKHA domain-containing protein [Syntrophales bacterium]